MVLILILFLNPWSLNFGYASNTVCATAR